MVDRVENMFVYYQKRVEKNIMKKLKTVGITFGNKGNGGDPPRTPPCPSFV